MRGRAYRRAMDDVKERRLRKIIAECRYTPHAGYIHYGWVEGVWTPIGDYIRYPKNSNMQKYLKRRSKRRIRRINQPLQGNSYRKYMEYWWEFY